MTTITAKTKTGNTVELSPIMINGTLHVHCVTIHPTAGKVVVDGHWTCYKGRHGIGGQGKVAGKTTYILLEVPQADHDTVIATARAVGDAENETDYQSALAACPDGYVPCKCNWRNGDFCSAEYVTHNGLKVLASDTLNNQNGWYWLHKDKVEEAQNDLTAKANKKTTPAPQIKRGFGWCDDCESYCYGDCQAH